MNVHIPESCTRETLFRVLGQVFDEDGEVYSNQYLFDAQHLKIVDPLSVVSLNNLFAWLESQGSSLRVLLPSAVVRAQDDLLRHFFSEGVYPHNSMMNVSKAMIPLAHIPAEKSTTWILTVFHRWFAEVLGISTLSLYQPLQFLRLLFLHAVHHSSSDGIILHATLNKQAKSLRILLAHYGIGIPQLARNSWTALSNDAVVIAKATEENKQKESTSLHDQASLFFLIDDIVLENGGELAIYSGFGYMKCFRTPLGITQKLELNHAFFPGALFDITLQLSSTGLLTRINEPIETVSYEST